MTYDIIAGIDYEKLKKVIEESVSGIARSEFTEYDKVDGTAADDYTPENTHEFPEAYDRFDILAEGGDLIVSMKKEDGVWGKDRIIKEGMSSIDFVITGIKVKNRNAGTNVYYEIVVYR